MAGPTMATMSTQVAAALISGVSALIGVLITAYSAELKDFFLGRLNRNKDLLGEWDCSWDIDNPAKDGSVQDIVTIQKISGEAIRAIANTPSVGKYRLTGRISQSSLVTFFWEGLHDRRPLGGVVILELSVVRNKMDGYWHQYGPERIIIGGATQWKRRTASTA
jgi:hypothetical protein